MTDNESNLTYYKWSIQGTLDFDFKPKSMVGMIPNSSNIVRLGVVNTTNSEKIWRPDSDFHTAQHDDQTTYEIPFEIIEEIQMLEKMLKHTTLNNDVASTEQVLINIVDLKIKDSTTFFPVLCHSDFDYARTTAEYIAKACGAPIRELSKDGNVLRLNTFLDTPYYQLMETPSHTPEIKFANVFTDINDDLSSRIEWYSPYFLFSNPKAINFKVLPIIFLLFGLFSSFLLYDSFSNAIYITLVLIMLMPFLKCHKTLVIDKQGLTYNEDNFICKYSKYLPFEELEEISLTGQKAFIDFSNYFFSDVSRHDFPGLKFISDKETVYIYDEGKSLPLLRELIDVLIYRATHKTTKFDKELKERAAKNFKRQKDQKISKFTMNATFWAGWAFILHFFAVNSHLSLQTGVFMINFSFGMALLFPPAGKERWKIYSRFMGLALFAVFLIGLH